MKTTLNDRLFLVLFITFTTGTYLASRESLSTCYFAIFYFLALYILRRSVSEDFYVSAEKNRFMVAESKVIVLGEALPAVSREDLQEERYMNHYNLNTFAKRQFFTYFFIGLAAFLLFMMGNVPLSLASVIPVICGFLFIRSVYIGHLLLPLAFNIYSVIAYHDQTISSVFYALYIFQVFLTLKSMSELSGEHLKWKKTLAVIPAVLLFITSIYGLNFFFNQKPSPQEISKALSPARKALRQAKSQSNSLLAGLGSIPESGISMNLKLKLLDQLKDITKLEQELNSDNNLKIDPKTTRKMLEKILRNNVELAQSAKELKSGLLERQEGSFSPSLEQLAERHGSNQAEKLAGLKEALEKNQEQLFKLQNRKSITTPDQDQQTSTGGLEKLRDDLKTQFDKMSELSSQEKRELNEYIEQKRKDLKVLEAVGDKKENLEQQSKNLKTIEDLAAKTAPSIDDLKQISEKLKATKEISSLKEMARSRNTEPIQEINSHDALKTFDKKNFNWKKIIPLIVFALGLIVVSYFMKKKGIKEVEILDPEALKEIKEEWRKLKKLKLSPREEVIHYYNVLHDVFQKVHYPEHETPPSCIVFEDMKDFNPKLDRATFFVTEIYAQCFYGSKDVDAPSLKSFRKSVNAISQVYGL